MDPDTYDPGISDLFEGSAVNADFIRNADLSKLLQAVQVGSAQEPGNAAGDVRGVPVRNPNGDLGRPGSASGTEG